MLICLYVLSVLLAGFDKTMIRNCRCFVHSRSNTCTFTLYNYKIKAFDKKCKIKYNQPLIEHNTQKHLIVKTIQVQGTRARILSFLIVGFVDVILLLKNNLRKVKMLSHGHTINYFSVCYRML